MRDGLTNQQTADHFGIGIASVARWRSDIEPKGYPKNRKGSKIDMEALAEDVRLYPDAYQSERAERFGVSAESICRALQRLGVTYKKSLASSKSGRRQKAILPKKNYPS